MEQSNSRGESYKVHWDSLFSCDIQGIHIAFIMGAFLQNGNFRRDFHSEYLFLRLYKIEKTVRD